MRSLIFITLLSLFVLEGFAQERSQDNENNIVVTLSKMNQETLKSFGNLFIYSSINEYDKLGEIKMPALENLYSENESNIKLIVNQLQSLIDTNNGEEFKDIELVGAQRSVSDGVDTVEIIKGSSIKFESLISCYIKRFYK